MKKRRIYTDEEIAFIRKWWGRKSVQRIAKSLRRKDRSIRTKAHEMGLQNPKPIVRWTDDEIRTLCFYYGQESIQDLAKRIGRPYYAVNMKIQHLGLKADRKVDLESMNVPYKRNGFARIYWNANMINILRLNYSTRTTDEVAAMIGVSHRTVVRKAKELGLTKDPEYIRQKNLKGIRLMRLHNMIHGNNGQWQHRDRSECGLGFMAKFIKTNINEPTSQPAADNRD